MRHQLVKFSLEDLELLKLVGNKAWESTYKTKELIPFVVKKDLNDEQIKDNKEVIISKEVKVFLDKINYEINTIWLKQPHEINDLFMGTTENIIGSFGYYFNSVIFVDGLIRSLGISTLGDLLRMIDNSELSLNFIKKYCTTSLSPIIFEFLEFCGFKKLYGFFMDLKQLMEQDLTREEYKMILLRLTSYVNRLSGWMLHQFNWDLGKNLIRG